MATKTKQEIYEDLGKGQNNFTRDTLIADSEASTTGTSTSSEQWAGVALPLVRRVFAEIAAKEFVSVQPMNLPSGLVFYLDFKYGSGNHLGQTPGTSLFGGTNSAKFGSTDAAVNGLYGQGRYAYSERTVTSSAFQSANASVASASWVVS